MTYPLEKLVFFDFETRSPVDLRKCGTFKYMDSASAIILTYAIGDQPVVLIQREGRALAWADFPAEFQAAFLDTSFKFVAWNCSFDRAAMNYAVLDSPFLEPQRTLDAMAQAMASNLPPALDMTSVALHGPGKMPDGRKLIGMFTGHDAVDPKDHPEAWDRFCEYAARDTAILRDIWRATRPLSEMEWRVYWANERICERGIGVDVEFCRAASRLAIEDGTRAGRRLAQLTGGAITSVNQHIRIAQYVWDALDGFDEVRDIMTTAIIDLDEREEDDSETGQRIEITINRGVVSRLIDWMNATNYGDKRLREILELREFGASAAPKKYAAALSQETGGRLRGQIVFNGAAQTGRFSGKGVQPQNLTRTPLGPPGDDYGIWEPGAIDLITDGCTLEALAAFGDDSVPSRKLSLLVRPAIIAPPGRTLIKADYEQVEARCLPWLANSPSAEKLLEYFRAVDADPSLPDLYVISAAGMLHKRPGEITKQERQIGKVSTLACGYGGGKGAFAAMGAGYRLYVSPTEAQEIVDKWRAANPWAPAFWGRHNRDESYGLWGATMRAYHQPGSLQTAGRISFIYEPSYLSGTLFMRLPSGRLLTYPWCKWREYEIKDKRTGKVKDVRKSLTFRRPGGMRALYGGLLAENATQATCADLLREALVVLEEGLLGTRLDVVLHAHDEIVAEVDDNPNAVRLALERLESAMTFDRHWAKGFPLAVDATVRWYYSAAKLKEAA